VDGDDPRGCPDHPAAPSVGQHRGATIERVLFGHDGTHRAAVEAKVAALVAPTAVETGRRPRPLFGR
jgi:hypothetical protein